MTEEINAKPDKPNDSVDAPKGKDPSEAFWKEVSENPPSTDRPLSGIPYGSVPWLWPPSGGADQPKDSKPSERDRFKAQEEIIRTHPGMEEPKEPTLKRDAAALKNVKDKLFDPKTTDDDKARAAAVLAANGETEVTNDKGGTYKIVSTVKDDKSSSVSLTFKDTAQSPVRTINRDIDQNAAVIKHDVPPEKKDKSELGKSPVGGSKKNSIDDLFDPKLTIEDRIKTARDMAHNGQTRFNGPDKHLYEITTKKYGERESVVVQMDDGHGRSRPILRGVFEKDGTLNKQRDPHHKEVDFSGDWAKKHNSDNVLLHHEQPKSDKPNEPDKPKPAPAGELENARTRLTKDVHEKVEGQDKQDTFLKQMDAFEKRAKSEPFSEKQIIDTYGQLSKLLEKEGKVSEHDRVLAAQAFAYHMAGPETIDQGAHNTCNMTSLGKRETFINPAMAAEIMTTTALTGEYVAKDGMKIKLDDTSFTPGTEERDHPPLQPNRSYATQLLNIALINDSLQRRMPPEFYSQERVSGYGSTGEIVRYADGTVVTKDSPGLTGVDVADEATRLEGRTKLMLAHDSYTTAQQVNTFDTKEDFVARLKELKAGGNGGLPAIINVDANDPILVATDRKDFLLRGMQC